MYTQEELRYSDLSRSIEKTKVDAIAKIVKGIWIVISGLMILDHFGVPASSILAVGGMGSLILGFAMKDILSDISSGLLLYWDRQFSIGDWIKIEQPKLEGTVESIGWRVSKIKTLDNRPLYVPNKFLGAAVIQNVSRRESMRFKEYLTIDLDSIGNVNEICNCIRESILINHDDIDVSQPVVVNVSDLNGAVINIYISAFTTSVDVVDFYNIKQDIWLKIVQVLNDHNAKICTSLDKELISLTR
ncbi:mechanosensitive ion channel family protein [Vibrio sp. D431a]|uniref:mechanosensitive ion channel family protein n=1 Tax=Vibrio sp. D431a TaxID=2837388 RepID=UPI002552EDFD|nr:mechanosensitive ion channel domain-containing protein [Vibrio sp. D431a]MDK9793872.1 mechanosensitive ion channel family protein [Vibrio sp. D431a]